MQTVHVFILKLVISELSVFKGYCFFTKWFCTSEDRNTNFKCSALPNLSFIHTETYMNLHRGTTHATGRTQALVRSLFFFRSALHVPSKHATIRLPGHLLSLRKTGHSKVNYKSAEAARHSWDTVPPAKQQHFCTSPKAGRLTKHLSCSASPSIPCHKQYPYPPFQETPLTLF